MRFIGRVFIILFVLSMGYTNAQTIRHDQINGFKDRVFNVIDYGARGDGVTDDTTAIKRALSAGAGKTVLFPSGTYKVTATLTPAEYTSLVGARWTSILKFYSANTTLMALDNRGVTLRGLYLYQVTTPTTGNYGIRSRFTGDDNSGGSPSGAALPATCTAGDYYNLTTQPVGQRIYQCQSPGNSWARLYTASVLEISDVDVRGFYIGVDINSSYNAYVTNLTSLWNLSHGLFVHNAQGYFKTIESMYNLGDGLRSEPSTLTRYDGSRAGTGTDPFMDGYGSYANGGWGVYNLGYGFSDFRNFFCNNDSKGEFYFKNPSRGSGSRIVNGTIQWAGYNPFTVKSTVSATTGLGVSPIEVTFTTNHGLTGTPVVDCYKIGGNLAANGTFTATITGTNKITLGGTTGSAAWTSGGYCSARVQNYPSYASAPSIYHDAASVGSLVVKDVNVGYGNGLGLYNAVSELSVSGGEWTAPGAGVVGEEYAIYNTGGFGEIYGVLSRGPVYTSANYNRIIRNRIISADASIPALHIPSGENGILTGNQLQMPAPGSAVGLLIDSGVTLVKGSNAVYGTVTDNGSGAFFNSEVGDKYSLAFIVANNQKSGYCTDCRQVTGSDNTCVGSGAGARFWYDYGTSTYRCAAPSTTSPLVASVNLNTQTAAIASGNLYVSAPGGTYEATAFLHTTTASVGACTSNVTIGYTFNGAAKTVNLIAAHSHAVDETSSTGTPATFAVDAGTHITRAVDLTAGGGGCTNAAYSVRIGLKRVI